VSLQALNGDRVYPGHAVKQQMFDALNERDPETATSEMACYYMRMDILAMEWSIMKKWKLHGVETTTRVRGRERERETY
jgi:hypothetical protein